MIRRILHEHAAKYNAHADRNNFASTNVDRTQITGVNSGMKKNGTTNNDDKMTNIQRGDQIIK